MQTDHLQDGNALDVKSFIPRQMFGFDGEGIQKFGHGLEIFPEAAIPGEQGILSLELGQAGVVELPVVEARVVGNCQKNEV